MTKTSSIIPRLALTVGVVGHRSGNGLTGNPEAICNEIRRILDFIHAELAKAPREADGIRFYTAEDPLISMVTSLASGADCLGARAALGDKGNRKYDFDAILPFAREIYAKDFRLGDERNEFQSLLDSARTTLTLPQVPHAAEGGNDRAYELASHILLAQSDLIVAVWNGAATGGRGGTYAAVARAARLGIPILHVDATGAKATTLLWGGNEKIKAAEWVIEDLKPVLVRFETDNDGRSLSSLLQKLVALPQELVVDRDEAERDEIGHDKKAVVAFLKDMEAAAGSDLSKGAEELRKSIHPFGRATTLPDSAQHHEPVLIDHLLYAFAAADRSANRFAARFRLAVGLIFFLAAVALICPAIAKILNVHHWHYGLVAIEFLCVATMIAVTLAGRKLAWHRRWIDAREVAERLRLTVAFWTLGIWPWPVAMRDNREHWIDRYVRALIREQSLCDNGKSDDWLTTGREVLQKLIDGQVTYHEKLQSSMHAWNRWLGIISTCGLVSVILVLLLFLALSPAVEFNAGLREFAWPCLRDKFDHHHDHWLPVVTTVISAVSFGAFGLKTTRDFEGVEERSKRSRRRLSDHLKTLESLGTPSGQGDGKVIALHVFALDLAVVMLEDLHHWRLQAESRVLDMPG